MVKLTKLWAFMCLMLCAIMLQADVIADGTIHDEILSKKDLALYILTFICIAVVFAISVSVFMCTLLNESFDELYDELYGLNTPGLLPFLVFSGTAYITDSTFVMVTCLIGASFSLMFLVTTKLFGDK